MGWGGALRSANTLQKVSFHEDVFVSVKSLRKCHYKDIDTDTHIAQENAHTL